MWEIKRHLVTFIWKIGGGVIGGGVIGGRVEAERGIMYVSNINKLATNHCCADVALYKTRSQRTPYFFSPQHWGNKFSI